MANEIRGVNSAAMADESQVDTAPAAAIEGNDSFIQRFLVLGSAAQELWATFGLKFLTITSYSLLSSTLVLWLTSDMKFTDIHAGMMISVWSAIMTLVTVLVGSLTDAIGIRRTLVLGILICLTTRTFLTASLSPWIVFGLGLFPVAVGEAMLGPVMVAATKRYATTAQRSMAFSIVYAVMNLAFLVAGYIFDWMRKGLGEHGQYQLPVLGVTLSTYRMLFLVSIVFMAPALVVTLLTIRRGVEVTDEGVTVTPEEPKYPDKGMLEAMVLTVRDATRDSANLFIGLWSQPGFIRFLIFLLFATFMRMIFYHTTYTLTPMGIRELGDGAPVGRLSTINNTLILVLVPLVGALTQKVSAYKMVVFGCCVGAASVFIMAVPVETYRPLAEGWMGRFLAGWLGIKGAVNPWYISLALFYAGVSVGEAFYSPRLYEYAAVIAPKGQEASYMALSYLPFFVAKLGVGTLSGFLLTWFCPKVGARHSERLCLVIALTTMVAPVGLIVFRKYLQAKEAGRE